MTQFIYHLIYIIQERINSIDTSQQPFNISTLPEKIKDIQKTTTPLTVPCTNVIYQDYDMMFLIHS